MQITLNQDEIEQAIKDFVGHQGISIIGKKSEVTLIAGRAPNGMSATITISDHNADPNIPTPRQARSANPTVVELSDVDASVSVEEESEEALAQAPLFGR